MRGFRLPTLPLSSGSSPAAAPVGFLIVLLAALSSCGAPRTDDGSAVLRVGDTRWRVDPDEVRLSAADRGRVEAAPEDGVQAEGFSVYLQPPANDRASLLLNIVDRANALAPRELALSRLPGPVDLTTDRVNVMPGERESEKFLWVSSSHDPTRHFDFVTCRGDRTVNVRGIDLGHSCRGYVALSSGTLVDYRFQADTLTTDLISARFSDVQTFVTTYLQQPEEKA